MNFHPIQLNFNGLINNITLSDIKLKANISDETKTDENDQEIMNIDDNKDDNKFNDSNMSLISSLDDNEDIDVDDDNDINNGIIYCHWDIIRSRCIVFDILFHAINTNKIDQIPKNTDIHIDVESNIIHFNNVSYEALSIVVKYLYTGLFICFSFFVLYCMQTVYINYILAQLPIINNYKYLYIRSYQKI